MKVAEGLLCLAGNPCGNLVESLQLSTPARAWFERERRPEGRL